MSRLSFLDFSAIAVDRPSRPATFALILHLESVDEAGLRAGAELALGAFVRSACRVDGTHWNKSGSDFEFRVRDMGEDADGEGRAQELAAAFVSQSIDPRGGILIRQLLIRLMGKPNGLLVTLMHHALGDGVALLGFLSVQLRRESMSAGPVDPTPVMRGRLRGMANSRKAPFRKFLRREAGVAAAPPSPQKKWKTLVLPEEQIKRTLRDRKLGLTLNDVLCAIVFKAMWSAGVPAGPLSLWLPINLRRAPFAGFGNASSRIRIAVDEDSPGVPVLELARRVRKQVDEALRSREWELGSAAEPMVRFFALPRFLDRVLGRITVLLLRAYFRRPSVNPCSSAFSFVSRVSELEDADAFPGVSAIESVGQLYFAHRFAFSAVTFRGRVQLTLFWDPAQLGPAEASELFESIDAGFRELMHELE